MQTHSSPLAQRLLAAAALLTLSILMAGIAAAAPLTIIKDDGLATDECVPDNEHLTYAICFDNTANDFDANNVVITDTLPALTEFVSADNQGVYAAGPHTVTWNIPTLAAGQEQTCVHLEVSVAAPPDTVLTNRVAISSDETDPGLAEEVTVACPIPVFVDIKPGGCPTPVNVGSKGVLPVAILGTADFDVHSIDPSSITLAGIPALRWSFEDVATPYSLNVDECDINDCHELRGDGYLDLTLKFDTPAVAQAIGQVTDRDCLHLELNGRLKESYGGTSIRGYDVVSILKKGKTVAPQNFLLLK